MNNADRIRAVREALEGIAEDDLDGAGSRADKALALLTVEVDCETCGGGDDCENSDCTPDVHVHCRQCTGTNGKVSVPLEDTLSTIQSIGVQPISPLTEETL